MNHSALFIKLMDRLIPVQVLSILENWFAMCFSCVKWGSVLSCFYELKTGVRQGGVLSPYLFSIFIDDLVKRVNKANVGCRIRAVCTAIFLYADDVILLAPSVFTLQSLVNICASELEFLDMAINVKKLGCMRFGPRYRNTCCEVVVSGHSIKLVESARYLGVYLVSSTKFKCSFSNNKASFFQGIQ